MTRIAAIQMCSCNHVAHNLKTVAKLVAAAKQQEADIVVLPEMFAGITDKDRLLIMQEPYQTGPIQTHISKMAKEHDIYIVAGTIPITSSDPSHYFASCLLFDNSGQIIARYDKIHLFDANVHGTESYAESATTLPGDQPMVAATPFGTVGLAVCYDLRFPELFRCLVQQKAEIIILPAAFIQTTGQVHWDILIRARAIENSCYFVAANQCGSHPNGRQSYGHSAIIDPWGDIMMQARSGDTVICCDIDLDYVKKIRSNTPFILHQKIPCGHRKK